MRFPSPVGAQVFLRAAQHSLQSGEIVSSGPLAAGAGGAPDDLLRLDDPGGRRTGDHHAGRRLRGPAVVLLGRVRHDAADLPRRCRTVAVAQHAAMVAAPGGAMPLAPGVIGEAGHAGLHRPRRGRRRRARGRARHARRAPPQTDQEDRRHLAVWSYDLFARAQSGEPLLAPSPLQSLHGRIAAVPLRQTMRLLLKSDASPTARTADTPTSASWTGRGRRVHSATHGTRSASIR